MSQEVPVVKYIKDNEGRFAGSIGDGKTAVPTAAPTVARPDSPAASSESAKAAYHERFRQFMIAKVPEWARHERNFSYDTLDDWAEDFVIAKETEYDNGPAAGSDRDQDWKRTHVQALLRAEKVSESKAGNQIVEIFHVKGIGEDEDGQGRVVAIQYTHDPRKIAQSYSIGYTYPDGRFVHLFNGDDFNSTQICYNSEVASSAVAASLDDYVNEVSTGPDGTPVALFIKGTCEWVRDDHDDRD